MGLPNFPVEGGCQCGAVRYRLKASPLSVYNCHCKDCQRFSGSAWSMSMPVRSDDFEYLGGDVAIYERLAESGRRIVMKFCAHCHTWLWNEPPAPGMVVVRAGSLDDMDWAAPVGNIWTESKAAWVEIDPTQTISPYRRSIESRCSMPGPNLRTRIPDHGYRRRPPARQEARTGAGARRV